MKKYFFILLIPVSVALSAFLLLDDDDNVRTVFTSVDEGLLNPDNVLSLNLNNQELTSIPKEIIAFKNLRVLNLSHNQLRVLPPEIGELKNLESVNLSHNHALNSSNALNRLSDCPNIKQLNLSHCRLSFISHEIGYLRKLEILDVSHNLLVVLPNEMQYLKKVRIVKLANNGLKELDVSLASWTKLESLDVRENRNLNLEKTIEGLRFHTGMKEFAISGVAVLPENWVSLNVHNLVLHQSTIQGLSDVHKAKGITGIAFEASPEVNYPTVLLNMSEMPALRSVGFTALGWTEIPKEIKELEQVKSFDFSGNRLGLVSEQLRSSKQLTSLNLRNNPLIESEPKILTKAMPDCEILYTKDELASTEVRKVQAPVPALDVPQEVYAVKAEKGKTLAYENSTVTVPANAFLDANGNVVTGKVDITYREFNNPLEIAMSGIPMTIDSGDISYDFSSAGMVEFRASQNGQALQANPKAPVKIEMASAQKDDNYNLYYFDEAQGKWLNDGNESINEPDLPDSVVQLAQTPNESKKMRYPTVLKPVINHQPINLSVGSVRKGKSFTINVVDYLAARHKKMPLYKTFPEIREVTKLTWTYDGDDIDSTQAYLKRRARNFYKMARDFSNSEVAGNQSSLKVSTNSPSLITDMTIRPNHDHDNYIMRLELRDTVLELEVYPEAAAYDRASSVQKRNLSFYKKYAAYKKKRDQQWAQIEKEYASARDFWEKEAKEIEAWNRTVLAELDTYAPTQWNATRGFALAGFGIYNCDRRLRLKQPEYLAQNAIRTAEGQSPNYTTLYLLDYTQNTCVAFYPGKTIRYDKKSDNALVYYAPNNKMGFLSVDDFERLVPSSKIRTNNLSTDETTLGSLQLMLASI